MTGIIQHFYAGGNTARGFTSLYDSSLQGLERLFLLEGGPGTGKSQVIQAIGEQMAENGYDCWFIHCASDNDALDGVIIPELKTGLVKGTAPRTIAPGLTEEAVTYVNFEQTRAPSSQEDAQAIIERSSLIAEEFGLAYSGFAEALRIHDDWEAIYIANMNFNAADELTTDYTHILYGDRRLKKESRVDHRFLGAATPQGAVDYVPNLTDGLNRYLIKGRPGSGKSTMLKKLAAAGVDRGFDVEIYHCGFDPNSLDMVIVRELGFAIFDSTAPHEYFPDRITDEIVDMYKICIKPGTDEAHAEALRDIKEQYTAKMKQSIAHLAAAKALHDELELLYSPSLDLRFLNRIQEEILQEMNSIAANID